MFPNQIKESINVNIYSINLDIYSILFDQLKHIKCIYLMLDLT